PVLDDPTHVGRQLTPRRRGMHEVKDTLELWRVARAQHVLGGPPSCEATAYLSRETVHAPSEAGGYCNKLLHWVRTEAVLVRRLPILGFWSRWAALRPGFV